MILICKVFELIDADLVFHKELINQMKINHMAENDTMLIIF